MTIRLFTWQVQKLKESKYPAHILRRAFSRYERGDFKDVVQNALENKEYVKCTTLTPFTIRNRFPIPDSEMRNILTMHWENPDLKWRLSLDEELKRAESELDELFRAYTGRSYIMEEINEIY